MREVNPEKYEKTLSIKMSEEEHQKIKLLAVSEKKTIKTIIFESLDRNFPNWRQKLKK